MTTPRFKDLSLSFAAHPMTGDLVTVTNSAAVTQSLKNIILTRVGELGFSPMGSNVEDYLFSQMTPEVAREISDSLLVTILAYEPRVIVNSIVPVADVANYAISLTINYQIRTINEPVSFTIFLKRA